MSFSNLFSLDSYIGLFTGFSLSCLIAFFLLLDAKWFRKNEMLNEEKDLYLTAMFPLFRFVFQSWWKICI